MADTFKCGLCEEEFDCEDDWTEEDRNAEYEENFGEHMGEERAVVCDDCYKLIMGYVYGTKN